MVLMFMFVPMSNEGLFWLGIPLNIILLMKFPPMGPFMTELFPTAVRGTGQGSAIMPGARSARSFRRWSDLPAKDFPRRVIAIFSTFAWGDDRDADDAARDARAQPRQSRGRTRAGRNGRDVRTPRERIVTGSRRHRRGQRVNLQSANESAVFRTAILLATAPALAQPIPGSKGWLLVPTPGQSQTPRPMSPLDAALVRCYRAAIATGQFFLGDVNYVLGRCEQPLAAWTAACEQREGQGAAGSFCWVLSKLSETPCAMRGLTETISKAGSLRCRPCLKPDQGSAT